MVYNDKTHEVLFTNEDVEILAKACSNVSAFSDGYKQGMEDAHIDDRVTAMADKVSAMTDALVEAANLDPKTITVESLQA